MWLPASGCSLSSDSSLGGLRAALEPLRIEPAGAARAEALAQAAVAAASVGATAPEAKVAQISPTAGVPGLSGERILGQSDGEVLRLLGKPALRRVEPPGEMWQYVAGGCVVHLFLYRAERGGEARVQHVEAALRGRAPADVAVCLDELRARRPAAPTRS
ncbi:MAG: hypothetical protein FJX68_14015 [Alphaproteobacteria bacterium]|nr:hypothetical protein [Alphaproteobacteria bacterium]